MKQLLSIFLLTISSTQLYAQTNSSSDNICNCLRNTTFSDTLSISKMVEQCVTNELVKSTFADREFMKKNNLGTVEVIRGYLKTNKILVHTSCDYVVKTCNENRNRCFQKMYDGSANELAQDFFNQASKAQDAGDLQSAITLNLKAINQDSTFIEAYDNLGLCYGKSNDFENAEKWYKKSLAIFPEGQFANQNLASLYRQSNQLERAVNQYIELLNLDLSNPEGYYGISLTLLGTNNQIALENIEYAINIYEILADIHVKDAYYLKGLLLRGMSDSKNSRKYLKLAKEKGANVPTELLK